MTSILPPAAERLASVRGEIKEACAKAGRPVDDVTLIAVSKTKPASAVREYFELGHQHFGENYVQEALAKQAEFSSSKPKAPLWHFIGHLQSNKAKLVVGKFHLIHGLDSLSLAQKLHRAAAEAGFCQDVLVEVNVDGEASKAGIAGSELPSFLEQLNGLSGISIKGLMCIPAPLKEGTSGRRPFAQLRELLEESNRRGVYKAPLTELSMGMSSDFSDAILEGATLVRVGTALFGARS